METLKCTRCGQAKPLAAFYIQKDRAKPRRMQPCKDCKKKYLKKWYSATWRKRPEPPEGYKYCPRCKRILPLESFQANAGRPDGKQAYCAECWPKYQQDWRATPNAQETNRLKFRASRQASPEKRRKDKARLLTNLAIQFGYLVPRPCEFVATGECKGIVQAHHTQYEKPLDGVRWLCEEHHKTHGHGGDFTNPPR